MDKNTKTILSLFLIVLLMVGLSFASVPLYDLFCRVTGFGGTTQVSTQIPDQDNLSQRTMKVFFDTRTDVDLPWDFEPDIREVEVRIGQKGIINYVAQNTSQSPVAGTAVYNVTPSKMGQYFHKVQCFCFEEQILQPGEKMNMPVLFYLDPKLLEDENLADVKSVTLSYTFFKTESEALENALEEYYERPEEEISPMGQQ